MKLRLWMLVVIVLVVAVGGYLAIKRPPVSVKPAIPAEIALANPDFEGPPTRDGEIAGWAFSVHSRDGDYEITLDRESAAHGHASLRIKRLHEQVYATASQEFPVEALVGKRIEFSAKMKTEEVGPLGWQLLLTFVGASNQRVSSTPMTGTHEFTEMKLSAVVPPGARRAEIAATLLDGGTAWLDDVHVRVLDR